ncbi:hypothetical protein BOX15_Mlig030435g1 [Macrostomum lignano]|uniref:Paramyosin n=1 Tax=Macrostomum lignano TaxID=282301 RepID=A0A267H7W2_9PLAT|nr:hypothetical protein BOX15_Mlig030435g1 [Macrostomum lignano]
MDDSYYDSIEPNAATTAGQQQQQLQSDSTSAAIKSPSVDLTLDSLDGDLDDDRRKDVADEDDFSHDLLSDDAAGVKECDCEDSLGATSSGAAKLRASVRQHVNHRGENMLLPNGSSRGSTPSTTAGGGAPRQRGLSSVRSQRHRQEESAAEKRRASLVERQRRLQGSTVSRDLAELDALGRVSAISDEQLVYLPHQSTGLPPQSVSRLPGGYTVLGPAFEESPVVPDFSAPLRNSSTVLATGAALNGARFGGSRKDVTDNAAPTTGTSAVAEECPECPRLRQRIGQLESQASSLLEQLSASRAVVEALTSATATGDAGGIARVDKALLAENRTLQAQLDAASAVGNDLEDVRRELRAAVAASSPAEAAELSARSRLLEQRCAELTQSCVDLRHANHQLQLSLGRVRGVLPDLSVADIELLERRWCDLPTSIGDQLEDGDILADRVRDEEGISDEHQVVQCLWYRHQVTKRSLSALQLRLASLGVSSANQLAHLDSLADSAAANAAEVERLRDQVAVKDDALRALEVSGGGGGGGSAGGGGISSSEANLSRVLASLERLDHLRPATAAAAAAAAATSSTTKEPPSAEVGELRNQLDVYREKLRMMADEKARLEEALQAASGLEETKRERDGIAANFDRVNRRWEADKERLDRLTAELAAAKEQAQELRSFEFKFQAADEERRSLRDQVRALTDQLTSSGRDVRDQISGRDEALRSAVSERDAARHEASELRAQLEAERQRQQSERQQAESRGADLTALRRELELSRRVAANQEAEKDRLMEELKRLGSAAGSSESAVRELRARCDQTVGHLRKTLQLVSVPEEEADDDNDASIGTFDGKTRLELQRARQALEELERAARDAEWRLSDTAYGSMDANARSVGVAATIGSGAPGASAAQAALESTRAAAAELRERLRAEERRRADEVGQLREALGASGARLRAERKRAEAAGREAEATARRLEAASAEAAALRACRDQAEQLRAELRDATARLDAARESNSQLQSTCALAQERQAAAEAGLQQLRVKCAELTRDNEELGRVSAEGGDKAEALVNVVERLKNRADKLALDNRALAGEKQALKESLQQAEADWQLERQTLVTRSEALKSKSDQLKRELRERAKEANEAESMRRQLERAEAALSEAEKSASAAKKRVAELESSIGELQRRLSQLEESETARRSLATELEALRNRLQAAETNSKEREARFKQRESQLTAQHRQRVAELDALVSQERSQLSAVKSKAATLEDEVEYLRGQLSRARKQQQQQQNHQSHGLGHADQVEQLILRSQSKAQQLLAGNPDLVRSFTPDSHLLLRSSAAASPTGSFVNNNQHQLD